ncbi:DNA polymerase delta [Phlyctema vagabunda]|uniref:DNA polymerase delta n=1 Tax=Phlyctema vagabunda TaxID=108571 RepID=A0ABR4PF58_9HELO
MPATRRSRASNGPATKNSASRTGAGAQQTLSFGNRVTKSGAGAAAAKNLYKPSTVAAEKLIPAAAKEIDGGVQQADEEDGRHHEAVVVVVDQQKQKEKVKTAEEERASRVSDAQIKRYWKTREGERKAPRVHQADLSMEEKILRLFDTSSQYGPCIGIARMRRWVRANKLGLQPPIEVLAVLLKEQEKGNVKIERAHVDELMSTKIVLGDD